MCMWICFAHCFTNLMLLATIQLDIHTILLKRAVRIMITPNQNTEETHSAVKAHQDHLRSAEKHCWTPVRGCNGLQ